METQRQTHACLITCKGCGIDRWAWPEDRSLGSCPGLGGVDHIEGGPAARFLTLRWNGSDGLPVRSSRLMEAVCLPPSPGRDLVSRSGTFPRSRSWESKRYARTLPAGSSRTSPSLDPGLLLRSGWDSVRLPRPQARRLGSALHRSGRLFLLSPLLLPCGGSTHEGRLPSPATQRRRCLQPSPGGRPGGTQAEVGQGLGDS